MGNCDKMAWLNIDEGHEIMIALIDKLPGLIFVPDGRE